MSLTIRQAVEKVLGVSESDVKAIMSALTAETVGYAEEESAAGCFHRLDVDKHLSNLSVKHRTMVQMAQDAAARAAGMANVLTGVEAAGAAAGGGSETAGNAPKLAEWAKQLVQQEFVDGFLHQPQIQPHDLPPRLEGSLYIRSCYRKLYDLLWSTCYGSEQKMGFIITGTPGIGKSAFALYLLHQLGRKQQLVYYDYQYFGAWQRIEFDFRTAGSVAVHHVMPVVPSEKAGDWRIIEGPPPVKEQYDGCTHTIVLSSPNHDNFNAFYQGKGCQSPLYMPTWSLEELQACREQLYPCVTADDVKKRYSWLGGNMRYVLAKFRETDPEELVRAAINQWSAQSLVSAIQQGVYNARDVPHILGHFKVGPDFKVRYVTFASPQVADLVLDKLAQELKGRLRQYLLSSQDDLSLGGLRGVLFERSEHRMLVQDDSTCRWQRLQEPSLERSADEASSDDCLDEVDEFSHHFL